MSASTLMQLKTDMSHMFATVPGVSMERVFRAIDTDQSGNLDVVELMCGLNDLGVEISPGRCSRSYRAVR